MAHEFAAKRGRYKLGACQQMLFSSPLNNVTVEARSQ